MLTQWGRYIETDWIFDDKDTNNRCLIKIQIVSQELVSNGVETNFCVKKRIMNEWINDNQDYIEEEKQLTFKNID